MSKPSKKNNDLSRRPETSEQLAEDSHWQPTTDILKTFLNALASLRLTVALLGMSVFIVLAGTLGQVHRDIWEVIHDYFRMNLSEDFNVLASFSMLGHHFVIPTPVTWIDLKILFPPSFSEGHVPPDLSHFWAPARIGSSLVLGLLWASLVWLIPFRDKRFQWGLFSALGLTLVLFTAIGSKRIHTVTAKDGANELDINLDVASVRTFTIDIGGETSAAIDHDATVSEIQAAVDEMTGVTIEDFTVSRPTETTVRVEANPTGKFGGEAVPMSATITARPGGFWFPKGWTIGAVMAINLLAAHLFRFKIQAKGARLWAGVGVIALGILVTIAVISSGSDKDESNIKLVEISGTPTGGTYEITVDYPFSHSFSEEFAYNASSAEIQERFRKHEGLENLVVTTEEGNPPDVVHQFVFDEEAEDPPNLNVDITQLTGGTPAKTVQSTQDWFGIWILFQCVLAVLLVLCGYAYISLWRRTLRNPPRTVSERSATIVMRRVAGMGTLLLAGLFFYLLQGGAEAQLNASGMRILWQLLKATLAGLILLAGCMLVFRKRGGVVVLHAGIALIMLSELLVGIGAVETQMTIVEGESANYVQDVREIEMAVIDPNDPEVDRIVTIPKRMIKAGNIIQDERLPVNIEVDKFYKHSVQERLKKGEPSPATEGVGQAWKVEEAQGSTGTDNASQVDIASAYVTLYSKTETGANDRELGTWLISQYYKEQPFQVGDKTYEIELRLKRIHKPYTITLNKVEQKNYVGTATPRDYRSIVDLKDPARSEDRHNIHIWMNNPLRYAGETFYQSGVNDLDGDGSPDMTVLSIVTNDGWMIPYVACMIVAVGMLAHFLITLSRFLNRDNRIGSQPSRLTSEDAESETPLTAKSGQPQVQDDAIDPLQKPAKWPWLTPVVSIGLVLVFGGYLASKARPPKPTEAGLDLYRAGQIPVTYEGRVKPLDTLARNSLRIMSNRQEYIDDEGNQQPAVRWLFDLITKPEVADDHKVFRIDYQPLLDTLNLPKRKGHLYSYAEIKAEGSPDMPEFNRQLQLALEVNERNRSMYQKKVLELARRVRLRDNLGAAFHHKDIEGPNAFNEMLNFMQKEAELERILSSDRVILPLLASQATDSWERYGKISLRAQVADLAKQYDAATPQELAEALIQAYEKPLAAGAIKRLRQGLQAKARQSQQTFSKTAEEQAEQINDPALKQIFTVLAESKPRETDEEIAGRLSDPVRHELSKQEAAFFLNGIGLGEGQLTGDRALQLLELIALRTVQAVLQGESLKTYQDDLPYGPVFAAYKAGNADAFNQALAKFETQLAEDLPEDHEQPIDVSKLRFESFFNNAAPFYYLAAVYLIAGILAAVSWLACFQPLNRGTFWLLTFCLVVHTAALIGRIYISGRPPVTNLYSSAVFIGWGCVLLGLLFEWFYDIGIGNLVAAVAGFMTLGVAHLLTTEVASFRGDSFTVLQAVLDTQFWLATHVVCISLGYAATYVAGFLGIAYIMGGVFTPLLTESRRKDLLRMIYGTLCFAIFFSFVGTVLGGLWADDSWGRFWGWDTKENGALIIVLWNALVLHARWGGIVKDRGLATLAVAGNIAVSWSWFGVNELGIGLHSYGFTEGVLPVLALFCISQVILVSIGCLPKDFWWSHIAEQNKAKA